MAKNFYETLGVPKDASDKDIRGAYRKLARKYHPDVSPNDKTAEARFKEVTAAYEVISDAENRKKYDKHGDRWQMADQIEEAQRRGGGFGRGGGVHGGADAGGDFGSLFDNLFRGGRGGPARQPANRRGQDIETPVEVSLEEAFHGTTRTVSLQNAETCPTCTGTGEVAAAICHTCEGSGQVIRPRRLEVKVPPGVRTGSRVRVAGEGRAGSGAGPSGDLYLVLTLLAHARFERNGDDLTLDVPVSYLDAILGGEVTVQAMDSRLALRIPELTQNGRQIRLSGKGMPKLGGAGRGDLIVRVRVQLPESLSAEERSLFEQLRAVGQSPRQEVPAHEGAAP